VGEMVAATRGRGGETGVAVWRGDGVAVWGRWWLRHSGRRGLQLVLLFLTVRAAPPTAGAVFIGRRCSSVGTSPYLLPFSRWFTGRRLASPPLPLGAPSPVYCSPTTHRVDACHASFAGRRESTPVCALLPVDDARPHPQSARTVSLGAVFVHWRRAARSARDSLTVVWNAHCVTLFRAGFGKLLRSKTVRLQQPSAHAKKGRMHVGPAAGCGRGLTH
jgi:hypothetical protein